jgi:hypothetical protein
MEFIRKFVLVLVIPLLIVLLYLTAASTAGVTVFTDSVKIKAALTKSQIYQSVVPAVLDEAGEISAGGQEVPLGEAVVRQAAEKTFTPQFIQQNTEAVIDSIYVWLNGDSPVPDFAIDLTATKASFATNVADAVEAQLASLPACPSGGVPDNFDPFTATCLPPGMDPASSAATVEENILSGTGFLDDEVITADSLNMGDEAKSVFADELKQFPDVYQSFKLAPIVIGFLALFLAAAVVLLSASKRKGVQRVGIVLVVVGVILLAVAYDAHRLVGEVMEKLNLDSQVLEDSLRTLAVELAKEVSKIYWIFGGVYTGLGVLAIVWTIWKRPKGGQPDDDDLEGEGKTPEDRINLKEPDEPAEFVGPRESSKPAESAEPESEEAKPEPEKPKPKPKAKPAPKKPTAKKITVT